jgi:hypothetical protein
MRIPLEGFSSSVAESASLRSLPSCRSALSRLLHQGLSTTGAGHEVRPRRVRMQDPVSRRAAAPSITPKVRFPGPPCGSWSIRQCLRHLPSWPGVASGPGLPTRVRSWSRVVLADHRLGAPCSSLPKQGLLGLRPRSARRQLFGAAHRAGARSAGRRLGDPPFLARSSLPFRVGGSDLGPGAQTPGRGIPRTPWFPGGFVLRDSWGWGRAPVPAPLLPLGSSLAGRMRRGGLGSPSFGALASPSGPLLSGLPSRLGSFRSGVGGAIARSSAVECGVWPFPVCCLVPGRIDSRAFIHRRVRGVRLHCWSSNTLSFHGLLSPPRSFLHRRVGAPWPVPDVSIRSFPLAPSSSLSGSTRDAESRTRCRVDRLRVCPVGKLRRRRTSCRVGLSPSPGSKVSLRR